MLITVYLVLAIAATARSLFQIIREFETAPFAIILSAVAAVVYIIAAIGLIRRSHGIWRLIAWVTILFELAGVLIVGTLSWTHPEQFGIDSVWSGYGAGYIWVPLVLPVLGIIWLIRDGREERAQGAVRPSATGGDAR